MREESLDGAPESFPANEAQLNEPFCKQQENGRKKKRKDCWLCFAFVFGFVLSCFGSVQIIWVMLSLAVAEMRNTKTLNRYF